MEGMFYFPVFVYLPLFSTKVNDTLYQGKIKVRKYIGKFSPSSFIFVKI